MAKHHPNFLLPLLFLITATVSATFPPPNNKTNTPPLSTIPQLDDRQLNNIIDALVGTGDFNSWENIINAADESTSAVVAFPFSATFFIPSNDFRFPLDPFIFPYHIVPQRLSFSDLLLLKPLSRLPTLLPKKSILVTNTSASNFTLDDSLVFYPDLYLTSTIAVHGIQNILDYSLGSTPSPPSLFPPPPPPPHSRDSFVEEAEVAGVGQRSSDAVPSLCGVISVIFLVVFVEACFAGGFKSLCMKKSACFEYSK
ncbi:hypothetical protein CICLE_v10017493mg [Citrus x clementina]|uniref:FAS1 domain-containing protein n=1 Tax=Citrus clementina TaxID=85681 RepID=V4U7T8_CITCL|nr:hypothetical protein CICLE_v10017493mg [Citrus x clementina]